ncbi:uncharacterized protein LOC132261137 [Phlebotomus argentipes]|uniref:uncharacterized protein LOC132261137 n=1 Tax=Phlebotomus argentipes TaxID=94469 RepID=UPI0028933176|nr:uncharacterized protein LOC132261137 [Phlebotomus argentipes]
MRIYKHKTQRLRASEELIREALADIRFRGLTMKAASEKYGIPYTTMHSVKKRAIEAMGDAWGDASEPTRTGLKKTGMISKFASRQVFSSHEERNLEEYLIVCSKLSFGLTLEATQKLAYEHAKFLQRRCPPNWEREKKAGRDWIAGFLKRHRQISLRKPENTSLARNISFNRENLSIFYDNLESLLKQHSFAPCRIWNLDETGLSTVLQAPRVVAPTNARQVGQCVSGERGVMVSIVGIVNASGGYMPPVYLFPRKRLQSVFMEGAPSGAIGLHSQNSSSSSYMDTENFLKTLDHILVHAAPSKEDPILLILDNHASHTSLDAIKKCRENGIHMLTLPPHTSHKTQPLDISVFGPFKSYCKTAFNDWITENAGQKITLHNIVEVNGMHRIPDGKCFTKHCSEDATDAI